MTPRVTVLSSLYRDAPFVRQAIESVLAQTFTDFEYLIINDAAVDDSRALAASYDDPRIRIVDNETNLGLTKSLNRGLALARGELIARFDSNDICFPERLATQVAFLDAHPDVAAVGIQSTVIDVAGRRLRRAETRRPTTEAGLRWYCLFDTPLIHPGAMFRRAVVWDELGGYDEAFRVGQDAELWLRVSRRHKLANLDQRLMALRVDPRSISGDTTLAVRAGHRERFIRVTGQNIRRFLEWEDFPEEWPRTWVQLHEPASRLEPAVLERFADAVGRCFERFCELNPEARRDRDVARQRSQMLMRIAQKLATTKRRRAVRFFARAARIDASETLRALPKLAAVIIAGDLPVRLWRRWRHGRSA